jgi:DNA-binding response OmpR family regulator
MITYNLEKEGYKTVSVLNGEESLGVIDAEQPDLVILDLMLPGLDGLIPFFFEVISDHLDDICIIFYYKYLFLRHYSS